MTEGLMLLNEMKREWCKNCKPPCNGCAIATIEQQLKALEILYNGLEFHFKVRKTKEGTRYIVKIVNFDTPSQSFTWDMTKEEYDSLKEVLL